MVVVVCVFVMENAALTWPTNIRGHSRIFHHMWRDFLRETRDKLDMGRSIADKACRATYRI